MATRDQDVPVGTAEGVLVREGSYGTQVMTVEPGGAEFIPLNERHGRPLQLFWTWTSPNMEFATIFVGVLAVARLRPGLLVGGAGPRPGQRDRRRHPGRSCPCAARSTGCRRWC